jgi:hypothetical protein
MTAARVGGNRPARLDRTDGSVLLKVNHYAAGSFYQK